MKDNETGLAEGKQNTGKEKTGIWMNEIRTNGR